MEVRVEWEKTQATLLCMCSGLASCRSSRQSPESSQPGSDLRVQRYLFVLNCFDGFDPGADTPLAIRQKSTQNEHMNVGTANKSEYSECIVSDQKRLYVYIYIYKTFSSQSGQNI